MRKKKDIPLVVLETLEPFIKQKDKKFEIVQTSDLLLHIIDADPTSNFYFKVKNYEYTNHKTYLNIDFKPQNKNTTKSQTLRIEHATLEVQFKNWTQRLEEYDKVSLYDDPIIEKNKKRFLEQFKLIDEDADLVSFDLQQQLYLDEYLDTAKSKLSQLKESNKGYSSIEIEDLESDINTIKSALTKEPKNKIIKRLAIFWGKAQKVGLEVIKEIFLTVATELTKKLISGN